MDFNIPLRPKGFDNTAIRKADADCLTYVVLYGCKNEDAFARFHPEYLDNAGRLNTAGKNASRQFFMYAKNKQYIDDYKATLAEFLGKVNKSVGVDEVEGVDDSRKDRALKSLFNHAMSLVEGNAELDADTLKIAAEIFKKIGLLKDEEVEQEAPRRYLPERCSACIYKSFVESHVESGEVENACLRCKALTFAKERGFIYDATGLLEISN